MPKVIKLKNDTYLYGTILEKGSNSNGDYIKFSDGTMICTKVVNWKGNINTPWGVLYDSDVIEFGNYAMPFIETPIITANQISSGGALIEAIFNSSKTSFGGCWLCRPTSITNITCSINLIAIGKWK